jgi:hypothetical protein
MNAIFLIPLLTLAASQELISSFVLVSVGSSSPYHPLSANGWNDWDVKGPFELTGAGMREQYLLGKELKRRYNAINLLSDKELYYQVMLRSVDHNNTIESTISFLRGFLPDYVKELNEKEMNVSKPGIEVDEKFTKDLGNQTLPNKMNTLPFHTYYPHEEDLFDSCSCPKANDLINSSFLNNKEVNDTIKEYEADFINIVKNAYNLKEEDLKFPNYTKVLESVVALMDQYRPTRLKQEGEQLITNFFSKLYHHLKAGNKDANSYRAIPILEFIRNIFDASSKLPEEKEIIKIGFSFVKDEMLASFLSFVSEMDEVKIRPSSIVTVNLYKNNTVKLDYNDDKNKGIKGCEGECSFEAFKELVDKLKEELGDVKDKCKV